MSRGYRYLSKL